MKITSRTISTLLCFALVGLVLGPVQSPAVAEELGAGRFLVAGRGLLDPNFVHTVVLLLDHNDDGALGVIINRPTEVGLSEMVTDLDLPAEPPPTVWVGGPVAHWQVILLVRSSAAIDGAERVFEDIHFTASRDVLESVLNEDLEFRSYAGYAGWGPGQLEGEVERGGWLVLTGDAEMVFDAAPQELWRELIARGESQWAALR